MKYDFEAVFYKNEIYCLRCLKRDANVDIENNEVKPILASDILEHLVSCVVCGEVFDYFIINY